MKSSVQTLIAADTLVVSASLDLIVNQYIECLLVGRKDNEGKSCSCPRVSQCLVSVRYLVCP